MDNLNYHHLRAFWAVVREGGVTAAARALGVAAPTISQQVHALEAALGEVLLRKEGRRLRPTEVGRLVHAHAEGVFGSGRDLIEQLQERRSGAPARLVVGIAQSLPKLLVKRLLAPALAGPAPCHLVCREDRTERLLGELATHAVDVLLADVPLPPGSGVRAYNHLLGECDVTVFAVAALAERLAVGFPRSLGDAPLLLPMEGGPLRRALEQWATLEGVRLAGVAEMDDGALVMAFGQGGAGAFFAPTPLAAEVERQYEVRAVGRLPGVRERYYALSTERRIRHPVVAELFRSAREGLFAG